MRIYTNSQTFGKQEFEIDFDTQPSRGDYHLVVCDSETKKIIYISQCLDWRFDCKMVEEILTHWSNNPTCNINKIQFMSQDRFVYHSLILRSKNQQPLYLLDTNTFFGEKS